MVGFKYVLKNYKKNDICKAEIWRYKSNGFLRVVSTTGIELVESQSSVVEPSGWEKLSTEFRVPDESDGEIVIEGINLGGAKTAYFDDFKIDIIRK